MPHADAVPSDAASRLGQLQATFHELDEWGEVLARSFIPEPGSALSLDDMDWPPVPVSQVAVMGLGTSRDHLHAIRVLIEAWQLFPFAHSTLVRGAIIGAAQTVWVLSPEYRESRLERARLLADHMYAQHLKYLNLLSRVAPEPRAETEAVAEHVRQRHRELHDERVKTGQAASLNTTEMVRAAAREAFKDHALVDEAESIWRLTSGAAHGFTWALLGQPDTHRVGEGDGHEITEFAAAGGIGRIANGYLCAFHLSRYGWKLLRRRSAP